MAAVKEARAAWKGDMTFEGIGHKGFSVTMDTIPEVGGHDSGMTPMELLLVALAGCTAMDVISILKKMRQDVTEFQVISRGTRADEHPKVYTEIELEYVVRGRGIDLKSVERAIELSETRYCSVSNMLNKTAKIVTTYRVEEAAS